MSADRLNDLTLSWANDALTVVLNGEELGVIDGWTGGFSANEEPIVLGAGQARSGDGVANRLSDFFAGEIAEAVFGTPEAGPAPDEPPVDTPVDPAPVDPDPVDPAPYEPTDPAAGDPLAPVFSHDGGEGVTSIAHDDALALSEGAFAMSFTAALEDRRDGVFSKDARGNGDGGHLPVYVERDGDLVARFQAERGETKLVAEGAVIAGAEHDLAFTFGEGGAMLYLDGALVASDEGFTQGLETNEEFLQLGALGWRSGAGDDGYNSQLDGAVRDFRLYDEQIGADQIDGLFA